MFLERQEEKSHLWKKNILIVYISSRLTKKSHLWKNIHKIKIVLESVGSVNISERPLVRFSQGPGNGTSLQTEAENNICSEAIALKERGGGKTLRFCICKYLRRLSNPAGSILILPNIRYAS